MMVMGRGVALEAAQRFPGLAFHLGRKTKVEGHKVHIAPGTTVPMGTPTVLIAFPTKPSDTRITPSNITDVMGSFKGKVRLNQTVQG